MPPWRGRTASLAIYQRPANKLHRGYFYLNDEVVINSLSALESGKVDEIVSRTVTAREGGFSGEVRIPVAPISASASGGKKSSSEIEEEMVRTRTRFSVFDAWMQIISERKGIGTFDGWGEEALRGVESGDTVELRMSLSLSSLQTVLRLFLWFADQAANPGNMFTQKGDQLRVTKTNAGSIRAILGGELGEHELVPLVATPVGAPGPSVMVPIHPKWMIGKLGDLGGIFGVVGQVTHVVGDGDEYPILRLTRDVTPTPLEIDTMKSIVSTFVEPAKPLGVNVDPKESVVNGPALIVDPIAIYR